MGEIHKSHSSRDYSYILLVGTRLRPHEYICPSVLSREQSAPLGCVYVVCSYVHVCLPCTITINQDSPWDCSDSGGTRPHIPVTLIFGIA